MSNFDVDKLPRLTSSACRASSSVSVAGILPFWNLVGMIIITYGAILLFLVLGILG